MTPDKVSVIIVTFNAGAVIQQAVESVISQQYSNFELVIIDGGSKDGTLDIIRSYGGKISCCISEPDNGIYDAMNKGIAASTGEWLIFLGADDTLCKNILQRVFCSSENTTADLIYGKVLMEGTKKTLGQKTVSINLVEKNIPHQAIFYSRSVLRKFNGYNLKYKILADYDLNLKIFEDKSLNKKFIDLPVSVFCTKGISNRTIDYTFFTEKKEYFITAYGLSAHDKRLAKYYFFSGVAMVLKKKYAAGFKNIIHPVFYSKNRFYYLLLVLNFIMTLTGAGRKYKYV